MFRVTFRSRPTSALGPMEFAQLIARAEARNEERAITAVMVRLDGAYVQFVEGPPRAVSDLMDSVWADKRHTQIEVLDNGHGSRRLLPEGAHMVVIEAGEKAQGDQRLVDAISDMARCDKEFRDWLARLGAERARPDRS